MSIHLRQPGATLRQGVIDDRALRGCVAFRPPIEQAGLQQIRGHAGLMRGEVASDCMLPRRCQDR
jgi:hypothetical protein